MLSFTHQALEKFDNQHDFERMCADILNSLGYTDVVLIAPRGGADSGRDITYKSPSGLTGLACISLRKDTDSKFREDFSKRVSGDYDEYIYFTNQYLTAGQKKHFTTYCLTELDALFEPKDIESLRSLLDTALQSVRKKYLNIEVDDNAHYSLAVVDIKKFSGEKLLQIANELLSEKKKLYSEKSSMANAIPVSFSMFGVPSTEDMLKWHEQYIEEVAELAAKAQEIVSFNIILVTDEPDQDIEISLEAPEGAQFLYGKHHLQVPTPPNEQDLRLSFLGGDTAISPNLLAVHPPADKNEFDAKHSRDGKFIYGTLSRINASHEKYVLNKTYYIRGPAGLDVFNIRAVVHSHKLRKPYTQSLQIDLADANLIDLGTQNAE